jgi:hypothetical protein
VVTDHSAGTKTMKVGRKKKKKRRILRIERQEYPDDRLRVAVEAKLPSSLAASTAMANSSATSVDAPLQSATTFAFEKGIKLKNC